MKFLIIFIIIGGLVYGAYTLLKDKVGVDPTAGLPGVGSIETKLSADKQLATAAAKEVWRRFKTEGTSLSNGPCLSNKVIPGWVADIVHNPRTEVDDLPANQCSAYLDGTAKHFVELDAAGNFVRAQ